MAVLTETNAHVNGAFSVTVNTGSGTDTFTYTPNGNQLMILANTTASPINASLHGDATQVVNVPGYGTVDPSTGLTIAIPANSTKAVRLDTVYAYLGGNASVQTDTGVNITILNM